MSELLFKVENMAQFIELYDDELHVQMPLAIMQVIKLKDITISSSGGPTFSCPARWSSSTAITA